jgi:predicted alpha/beta hydrolase family esterase
MSVASAAVLIIPGYTNSGPQHWQSLWQKANPEYRRVEQQDWDTPDVALWVAALDREVQSASDPVVLVAHSLGCVTVAHWVVCHPEAASRVAAALLGAPADIERSDAPQVLRAFGPIPCLPLPFPSVVVASATDPYAHIDRARMFAEAWRSRFVDIGDAGHINTAAGFGPWPDGEQILASLLV